jgi:small subunit ribosomal protein S4
MIGPKEKRERSVGERLNLKGERCQSPKCAMVRKPYRPGVHGPSGRRRPLSEFGLQLKEKQKVKLSYGLDERNLKQIFLKAKKAKGSSAAKIIEFLERRLDNVVFKLGWAVSRGAARQLVVHGHILVNGRKVKSPGFVVKAGDVVKIKQGSESKQFLSNRKESLKKYEPPAWLRLDKDKMEGYVLSPPEGEGAPFEVDLLVESFSK